MRVVAAMSGGVDSSVAAARMVDAGYEVTGVHLALARKPAAGGASRGCCTLDDARDARRVADALGIPFYIWDFAERFEAEVIDDFVAEYDRGRTPNPCMRCNERIKFSAVLERALALGFDAVATGHYARVVEGPVGPELHRGVDPLKDQSYVLAMLRPAQLAHVLLPLGADRKDQIRDEAERRGLLTARKPDSHDICFIPDGDTAGFLRSRLGERPGRIVDDASGDVLAEHSGSYAFTIGQRRGLGLERRLADGRPRYVLEVQDGTVLVGSPEQLDVHELTAADPVWSGEMLTEEPRRVLAQVRAHADPVPARAWVDGSELRVELDVPIRGVAAGQWVALYDGDRVLAAATIDTASRG